MKKDSIFYILVLVLVLVILGCGGGGGGGTESSYVGCYPKGSSPSPSATPSCQADCLTAESFLGYYPGGVGDLRADCTEERDDRTCLDDCNNFNRDCTPKPSCRKDCPAECPKLKPGPNVPGAKDIGYGFGWVWDMAHCSSDPYARTLIDEADNEEKACKCIKDSYWDSGCCGDDFLTPGNPPAENPDNPDVKETFCLNCKLGNNIGTRIWDFEAGACCGDDQNAPFTNEAQEAMTESGEEFDNPDWSEESCNGCPVGERQGGRVWAGDCCGDDNEDCSGGWFDGQICDLSEGGANLIPPEPIGDIKWVGCVEEEFLVNDGQGWLRCGPDPFAEEQNLFWRANVAHHDYICDRQGHESITECCGDSGCNSDSNDGRRLTTGQSIIPLNDPVRIVPVYDFRIPGVKNVQINNVNYCRTDSIYVLDLDTPNAQISDTTLNDKNKKTCEKAGFKWTGTKCCSEEDDPEEYYNDPGTVGGCWDKKLIKSISFVNGTNNSVINYGGEFHGCEINKTNFNRDNDNLLNLKDYHTKGQLIANHGYCFNDPNKNYYCSYTEKWLQTNGLDKTHFSSAPGNISNLTNSTNLPAECCAATECWDKTKCIENQRDNPLAEPLNGYRCIDGNWEEANKKFTMDDSVSGYCPKISQCLVNPFEKNETNQCIESGTYVIKPGPYTVDDNYCGNGFWTSRTKLLALKMLKLKTESNYTLFCDDRQSTLNNLNYIVEGEAAANILINIKTNNFCILKDGNKVIAGTTINKDIEDIPSTDLNIFGVTSCSSSGLVNDGQYHPCDSNKKVWYNKKLRSIIYSATGIGNIPTDASPVESFDQYIGNPIRNTVNTIGVLITAPPADDSYKTAFKRFDRLYFTQATSSSGSTPVLRAIAGSIEGRQKKNAVIGYTTFNDNVCNFVQSFNAARNDSFSGLACKNQGSNYYVLVQGSIFTTINPSSIWSDLTAKIRLK